MSLEQAIRAWDGRSADDIEAVYLRFRDESGFAANTIELSGLAELETGATWLLKKHFENGGRLSAQQTTRLFELAVGLTTWEARLHLLQSLPYLRIAETDRQAVDAWLRTGLADQNKFVRAWAYSGFHELARQYPAYRDEVGQLFEMALCDEAASVKARIRNLARQGF